MKDESEVSSFILLRTMLHEVITSEKIPFTYRVAGLGSRFLAALLDLGILAILVVVGLMIGIAFESRRPGLGQGIIAVWAFTVFCGYFVLPEWLWLGQTPGKRLLGIRVIQWDGTNITLGQSALRNLLRIVDILPGFYGVGFLAALSNPEQRRLGDLAANTLVVYLEINPPPVARLVTPDSAADRERRLQLRQKLEQLSREQKHTILQLCQRRDQLRIRARARLFGAVADYLKAEKNLAPGEYESDERFVSQVAAELQRRES
jgi:uncharacterized RDD family membrane protein YckC